LTLGGGQYLSLSILADKPKTCSRNASDGARQHRRKSQIADRQIPGKLDPTSGAIELSSLDATDTDDLLDDFAELTLKMGGEVMIVPAEELPSTSGAAATYRY
jgi:hypothetical protein